MKYLVIGCGRVGAELAYRLYSKGHKITVIDNSATNFQNLNPEFRGKTLEGDAMNEEVLHRAEIESIDGVAAVTNSDTYNAVVAHIARSIFHLKNIVVRNYIPQWLPLLELFGFQTVSSSSWGAQRVEELLYDLEMRTIFSAGNGEIILYEFVVPAHFTGKKISDLFPSNIYRVSSITHATQAFLPPEDYILEEGDVVTLSTTNEGITELRKLFVISKEV